MTRLDQNRAMSQLAAKAGVHSHDRHRGHHLGQPLGHQYPDYYNAKINGKSAAEVIGDDVWAKDVFIPTVQKRGKAIIDARGKSSAPSAAWAAIDHIHDWFHGTGDNGVGSMAVPSDGSYGIPEGLICSFPVRVSGGWKYEIVKGLPIDAAIQTRIDGSTKELLAEREAVKDLL